MEDGLADKTVYCMLQDSHGYMWFGTGGGVCKYDGNTMISYLHINGDSTSLANDLVNCIYEDTTHTVWIGTHNGLSRYDPVKKNFSNYYFDKWSSEIGVNMVSNITLDPKGKLWVSTNAGIFTTNPANPKFSPVKLITEKYFGTLIHGMSFMPDGRLFVLMDTALLYSDDYFSTYKVVFN